MHIQRRDKEDNSYFRLQQQSLEMLQNLSGKRWTDFNEHDPGVTIMDILNYNLLELTYQTEFDFEKYLARPSKNELVLSHVGLLSADEIFAPCVVTTYDYENLIETQVKGIKRCEVKITDENLYRIFIDVNDSILSEAIMSEVKHLYHKHRNLCENLAEIVPAKLPKIKKKKHQASVQYNQEAEKVEAQNAFTLLHTSVQFDFPNAYGINEYGLPTHATELQKVQALQLKGYLLIFDYMLSATKQQLGGLHQTLSLSEQILPPFSHQIQANDLGQLLDIEKLEQTEIFNKEELHKHKSSYLDLLDALYGEDTSFIAEDTSLSLVEVNRRRAKLIRLFPVLNTNRFRSFNVLESNDMPTINQLIGYIIGIYIYHEEPIANIFARYRLQLIDDRMFFGQYKQKFNIDIVEDDAQGLEPIPLIDILYQDNKYEELYVRINLLWYNILYQSFLSYGPDIKNYRIMERCGKGCLLIFKIPEGKGWITLGQSYEKETLIEAANLLCQFIIYLNTQCQNFYFLEHILLISDQEQATDCNTLSIVYSQSINAFKQEKYQERIKESLPVHVEVEFIGLTMRKMMQFEKHYYAWRKALASDNKEQIKDSAKAIMQLISNK